MTASIRLRACRSRRALVLVLLIGALVRAAEPGSSGLASPSTSFTIVPAATGRQLVRASLPMPAGLLPEGRSAVIHDGQREILPSVRVLARHPGAATARRALVTFDYDFSSRAPVRFRLSPAANDTPPAAAPEFPAEVTCEPRTVRIAFRAGPSCEARLLAPGLARAPTPRVEVVETNAHFRWRRWHFEDPQWPCIVEVREDKLGLVAVVAHVQKRQGEDGFAPELGWEVESSATPGRLETGSTPRLPSDTATHSFADGQPCSFLLEGERWVLYHPYGPLQRRGSVSVVTNDPRGFKYTYHRCSAQDRVPMQPYTWQRIGLVIAPANLARLTPTLEPAHHLELDGELLRRLYELAPPPTLLGNAELQALLAYHRDATIRSMALGDDWGNVIGFNHESPHGGAMGMNRLNHGAAIFEEAWRSADARLRETALLWCDNFFDLSVWWGPGQTGGTRYNNVAAQNRTPLTRDFMWRSNDSVSFCTKGYDAFLLAYEETGDPRFLEALRAQVEYAVQHLHANTGECRNIGDARDFVRLYEFTGETRYLEEALRLFRELRAKLSTGDLFDQGGKPLAPELPFLESDATGLRLGYAKPYIIGYALAGLPELARHRPDEPKLRQVIQAVADFLAESLDPVGGWRYPHPRSSSVIISQGLEHAWQLVQAGQILGPQPKHLAAIEGVLRARLHGWLATGQILSGLRGWEYATGRAKEAKDLEALYARPGDRDAARDYTEGQFSFGSAPPEGLVYLSEVLGYYLKHRPLDRLLAPPKPEDPLGQVLSRAAARAGGPAASPPLRYQTLGVTNQLPMFRDALVERLDFPLSWLAGRFTNFTEWRATARAKVLACWLKPPPAAPFDPVILAEQDRGSYVARKIVFNLTGDSRVLALLTVPKGRGPFPAVLLLHDHGAKFDIGKEKVIEPWDVPPERLASARDWVAKYYGGRFLGDELAQRGYLCCATDALNWGDRGGAAYEGQQALAANLLHLGMSHAGLIAWEDLRAAEFLATRREVDPRRVAAMGLSMGGFRTWQVTALSDRIVAGAAVGWMATVSGLMVPGNNQTRGQSAFTMTHPGLFNHLDYPDVAALACPKPLLCYNGDQDALFPVEAARAAFDKMRRVWESQGAGDKLETRFWNVPHLFNREMQDAAFEWLERNLPK